MICPRCYGKHIVVEGGVIAPCAECGGLGEIHCCDGLREQEELAQEDIEARRQAEEE